MALRLPAPGPTVEPRSSASPGQRMVADLAALTTVAVAALLLGGLTGLVATSKGHPFARWAALGGALPVVGLVAVMVLLPDRRAVWPGPSEAATEATRRSAVARALAVSGPATRDELAGRTGLTAKRVRLELSGLAELGMAERPGAAERTAAEWAHDRWQLSVAAAGVLAEVGPADDPVAGAAGANSAATALLAGPAGEREIARRAGLTRRQARLELSGLAGLGVVARHEPEGWRLTERGHQLLAGQR